jgi:prepilin-type processing-associated H-X9-DG protein
LLALLLPAVQQVRTAALRIQCANNLKQLGLALHQYHGTRGTLPAGVGGSGPSVPFPYLGWEAHILPYVEQDNLWQATEDAFRRDRFPFDNPPHVGMATVVPTFICPADPRVRAPQPSPYGMVALTSYLGVEGTNQRSRDGVLYLDSSTRFTDIADGLSNTLLVGERPPSPDFYLGWWYAGAGLGTATQSGDMLLSVRETNSAGARYANCPPGPYHFTPGSWSNPCDVFHFWSPHSGGAYFAYADGSVHFLPYSADGVLPALATRSGGEPDGWAE